MTEEEEHHLNSRRRNNGNKSKTVINRNRNVNMEQERSNCRYNDDYNDQSSSFKPTSSSIDLKYVDNIRLI